MAYVDLAPVFREQAAAGKGLSLEADSHPNREGNALIAEVILYYLKARANLGGKG